MFVFGGFNGLLLRDLLVYKPGGSTGSKDCQSTGSKDCQSTGSKDCQSTGSKDCQSTGSKDCQSAFVGPRFTVIYGFLLCLHLFVALKQGMFNKYNKKSVCLAPRQGIRCAWANDACCLSLTQAKQQQHHKIIDTPLSCNVRPF